MPEIENEKADQGSGGEDARSKNLFAGEDPKAEGKFNDPPEWNEDCVGHIVLEKRREVADPVLRIDESGDAGIDESERDADAKEEEYDMVSFRFHVTA